MVLHDGGLVTKKLNSTERCRLNCDTSKKLIMNLNLNCLCSGPSCQLQSAREI